MKNHDRSTRRVFIAVTGTSLLLAGCGNLIGPGKPLQLYVLDPQLATGSAGVRTDWQLAVAVPEAPASLDTQRIALAPTPLTMDYFADASWPDRLPLLLQSMLVAAFEKDGRAGAVMRDTSGLDADYVLRTEIRTFQAQYNAPDQAPDIVLRIDAMLVRLPDGKIVARHEMSEQAHAESNAVPAIVSAFTTATTAMLTDIVNWVVTTAPPLPPAADAADMPAGDSADTGLPGKHH